MSTYWALPNEILVHIAKLSLDSAKSMSHLSEYFQTYYEQQKNEFLSQHNMCEALTTNNVRLLIDLLEHGVDPNEPFFVPPMDTMPFSPIAYTITDSGKEALYEVLKSYGANELESLARVLYVSLPLHTENLEEY